MEADLQIRLSVLEELVRELIRSEIIDDDMIEAVAERLEGAESEAGETAAHQARMLPIEARAPAVRRSEHRAEFLRQQMRERTAMINCPDGGNDPT